MTKLKEAIEFVPANEKIMDINEDDIAEHICTISDKVPPNTVAIFIGAQRVSGTGVLKIFSDEGTSAQESVALSSCHLVGIKALRIRTPAGTHIKYAQSVANDDFDLYMLGYFIGGKVIQ